MSKIYATPLVRKEAEARQVDLAALSGTGAGGRITVADVRAAAGITRPTPKPTAVARATVARPSLKLPFSSRYASDMTRIVDVDVFGANPLLEEARAADPSVLTKAQQRNAGPPPELFTTGPVPAFTSSGIDPDVLMTVPWVVRPYMARVERAAQALELVETFGAAEDHLWTEALRHYRSDPGVLSYEGRMTYWFRAATIAPAFKLSDLRPNGGQ